MSAFVFILLVLFRSPGIDTVKITAVVPDSFSVMNPYQANCGKESLDTCVVLPLSVVRKTVVAVTERNFFASEIAARTVSDSLLRIRIGIDSTELVVVRTQFMLSQQNEAALKNKNVQDKKRFFWLGVGVGSAATALTCILLLIGIN